MITLSRLRRDLGFSASDDTKLGEIRSRVIALWEQQTGHKWDAREDYVETIRVLTPATTNLITLELRPVTAVTLVETRDISYGGSSWETLYEDGDSDDVVLILDHQLRRVDGLCWPGLVRVTYDGGVEEADEDVQRALVLQAQFDITRNDQSKLAVQSQNFEGGGGVFIKAFMHPTFEGLAYEKRRKS